jgi:Leucine-rich repeat (LRR) protein
MPSLAPPTVRAADERVKAHSSVALDALRKLENRESSASINTLTLHPPPRPVARRKRPFLLPPSLPRPPSRPTTPAVVLDGFVLLQTCRVEDPEEAQKAVLEGAGISAVVTEDMPFFNQLTHLDLGDNHVQLESLGYLPQLQELHLDCNGLCSLTVPVGGFPNLEVLNLSFNGLSAAAILALADIPRLRDLDLSHNELSALPASLARFASLESLNLEHNSLGSEGAWLSLASAPSLLALTLAHNRATALPARAAERGFAVLRSLSVAHNRIEHESDLLPVLQVRPPPPPPQPPLRTSLPSDPSPVRGNRA